MRCLVERHARVTESPVWDDMTQTLYFVDIHGHAIVAYDWDSGATREIATGQAVACIGLAAPGYLIAGLESSIVLIDVQSGKQSVLARITHARDGMRLNDGRCDPKGRFWVGSMKEALDEACGALYCLEGRDLRTVAEGIICSNGLAFNPDGTKMYHADSRRSTVWQYDYDRTTGSATDRTVFLETLPGTGRPDGAAVDHEGCYWIARYAGWQVVQHDVDGRERATISLPVENPTMCTFAGPYLDTLVITSARGELDARQLAEQPLAGCVFAIEVPTHGFPSPRFSAS